MLENLKAAIFEVLETMFFLFPETLYGAPPLWTGPGVQAWVPIKGPRSFRVGMTVPQRLAHTMTVNFLGQTGPDPGLKQVEDVVKEAVNMVAGNFLEREGATAAFQMQPPHSLPVDLGAPDFRLALNHLVFMVDDDGLEVFLERT